MFTPEELEFMPRAIEKLYSDLEWRVMSDIIRRIAINGEVTRAADWQIYRLHQLGESKEVIKSAIQDALNLTDKEIDQLYEDAIASGYTRDHKLYEAAGKEFIPYAENKVLQQMVKAIKEQTFDTFKNITQSLGFAEKVNGKIVFTELADFYRQTLDAAMVDIASGMFDYNTVLKRTIDTLTNSGLRTVDYASGWSNRVEVAARRAVMTGITQVTGKINEQNAEKLETEYFEVSWHADARPTHQEWQGRVYSKKDLEEVCGLGTGDGLAGWNCRHTYYPFIPGISERLYTDEQLDAMNEKENTPKEWNGKKYTSYEASQKQRKMETSIRAWKRKVQLLKDGGASGDVIDAAKCRYRTIMDEYARFSEAMKMPQQKERFYIGKAAKVKKTVANTEERSILTDEELYALNQYVSAPSYTINDALRTKEKLSPEEETMKKNLDSALQKMPRYKGNLVRTVDFSDFEDEAERIEKYVAQYEPKKIITLREYVSTSKAEGYQEEPKIVIYIRNATKGRDIGSVYAGEKEVLYERDTSFKILAKEKQKGIYYILLEEAP